MVQMTQSRRCLWCYLQATVEFFRQCEERDLPREMNLRRNRANFQPPIVPVISSGTAGKQH